MRWISRPCGTFALARSFAAFISVVLAAWALDGVAAGDAGVSSARALSLPGGSDTGTLGRMASGYAADTVIARDDFINTVYALYGIVLYSRFEDRGGDLWPATRRPWMRVINGRRLGVRGMPSDSAPFSIGRDVSGRVVVVLGRPNGPGTLIKRWWLYDVARDAARRLHVGARPGCTAQNVAVWKAQTAFLENCGGNKSSVVMRDAGGTRHVFTTTVFAGLIRLFLRARSLALITGVEPETLVRVLDHGRRCAKSLTRVDEEVGIWAGVGSRTLTWATANYDFDGVRFSGLQVSNIELSGRCQRSPVVRVAPTSQLPQSPFNANGPIGFNGVPRGGLAIDGRTLYFATDIGVHRLRLPD